MSWRATAQNPHALKNGQRKVCFCFLSWRIYFKSKKQKYRSKNWTRRKFARRKIFEKKDEDTKVENILAAELNEYISRFFIAVLKKDGT